MKHNWQHCLIWKCSILPTTSFPVPQIKLTLAEALMPSVSVSLKADKAWNLESLCSALKSKLPPIICLYSTKSRYHDIKMLLFVPSIACVVFVKWARTKWGCLLSDSWHSAWELMPGSTELLELLNLYVKIVEGVWFHRCHWQIC